MRARPPTPNHRRRTTGTTPINTVANSTMAAGSGTASMSLPTWNVRFEGKLVLAARSMVRSSTVPVSCRTKQLVAVVHVGGTGPKLLVPTSEMNVPLMVSVPLPPGPDQLRASCRSPRFNVAGL